jgi:hypothetical protein
MSSKKQGNTPTRVIYIGNPRYLVLCRHAREISVLASANVKPSEFLQFMIDRFSDQARAAMLMQLRNEMPQQETK